MSKAVAVNTVCMFCINLLSNAMPIYFTGFSQGYEGDISCDIMGQIGISIAEQYGSRF